MRSLLLVATAIVAGVGYLGCNSSQVTARDAPRPSAATTTPPTDVGRAVGSSAGAVQSRSSPHDAVARRAWSALVQAGVTDLRSTPGYDTEVNAALEGTWRQRPVQAYVVPTVDLPEDSGDGTTAERHEPIGGRPVEGVRGQHSSILFLKFELGPDTWMLASLKRHRVQSDERRSVDLVAALLATS